MDPKVLYKYLTIVMKDKSWEANHILQNTLHGIWLNAPQMQVFLVDTCILLVICLILK